MAASYMLLSTMNFYLIVLTLIMQWNDCHRAGTIQVSAASFRIPADIVYN